MLTVRKLLWAAWPTFVTIIVYVLIISMAGCASLERLADKGGSVTVGKGQKCPDVKVEVNIAKGAIVQTSTASPRK